MIEVSKHGHSHFPDVRWLLEEGYFGYIGTSDSHGIPHVTPVIFVSDGNSIFLTISKVAKKLANIRQNDRIAFLIDIRDPTDLENNRAVLIEGSAKIYGILDVLRSLRKALRVREMLFKKYPRYGQFYATKGRLLPKPWRASLFTSRLLVEVSISRLSYMRRSQPAPLERATL